MKSGYTYQTTAARACRLLFKSSSLLKYKIARTVNNTRNYEATTNVYAHSCYL